ncbi:hypothetical protein KKF84_00020 [Myxococcota bacterium]|nr:hypothetical protein [Myxococcota bacterium]
MLCLKNKLVLKKLEKVLFAAQVEIIPSEGPPLLEEVKRNPDLLIIGQEYLPQLLKIPKNFSSVETMVLYSDEADKVLALAAKDRRFNHLIGLREGQYPLSWEVLSTVRRLIYQYNLRGLTHILGWSARIHEVYVPSSKDMHRLVAWVPEFCEALGAPPKVRDAFAELAHELMMNAVYDAPVDVEGNHLYAQDRKQEVSLHKDHYPLFSIGTNGDLLGISVRDPFGGLKRKHIFNGLDRALSQKGQINTEGGGAGLGMLYIYNHGFASFFSVKEGEYTEVSVIYDITMNRRDFATLPKSVHYFVE